MLNDALMLQLLEVLDNGLAFITSVSSGNTLVRWMKASQIALLFVEHRRRLQEAQISIMFGLLIEQKANSIRSASVSSSTSPYSPMLPQEQSLTSSTSSPSLSNSQTLTTSTSSSSSGSGSGLGLVASSPVDYWIPFGDGLDCDFLYVPGRFGREEPRHIGSGIFLYFILYIYLYLHILYLYLYFFIYICNRRI